MLKSAVLSSLTGPLSRFSYLEKLARIQGSEKADFEDDDDDDTEQSYEQAALSTASEYPDCQ
jgi:hypothetical protein